MINLDGVRVATKSFCLVRFSFTPGMVLWMGGMRTGICSSVLMMMMKIYFYIGQKIQRHFTFSIYDSLFYQSDCFVLLSPSFQCPK
jgi:hypothetical protein